MYRDLIYLNETFRMQLAGDKIEFLNNTDHLCIAAAWAIKHRYSLNNVPYQDNDEKVLIDLDDKEKKLMKINGLFKY